VLEIEKGSASAGRVLDQDLARVWVGDEKRGGRWRWLWGKGRVRVSVQRVLGLCLTLAFK
jgi:hypothetical protein